MNLRKPIYLLLGLVLVQAHAANPGYLRAQGKFIGTDTGLVQLRGLGLGGWMLQEGYMIGTDGFAGSQHLVQAKLASIVGAAKTEAFYQTWRDNFITKADIDSLAAWGFNSVRLPMHWNLYMDSGLPVKWKEEGFRRTDSLVSWCKANHMWVILDLHAAPGGQGTDNNISDGDPGKPNLWQSPDKQTMAVALWGKLADHYKNEPWIGGYDLLNETNWGFDGGSNGCSESSSGNGPLQTLLTDMTKAIRAVDTSHLVIVEGNCWGIDYSGFDLTWDNNMAISFHHYWKKTDSATINTFLKLRNKVNKPLWMGESGENGNDWFRKALKLFEHQQIGWSWWPYKKINSTVGPASVTSSAGWDAFRTSSGSGPDAATLTQGLTDLADNLRLSKCRIQRDVMDAMIRQVSTDSTKPWRDIHVPGKFGAEEYDLGGDGFAYHDSVSANYSGSPTANLWNTGLGYRNDGVDIKWVATENAWAVTAIYVGEWTNYTVVADSAGTYTISARVNGATANMDVLADNALVTTLKAPTKAGWTDITSESFALAKGRHVFKLRPTSRGFDLGGITVAAVGSNSVRQVHASLKGLSQVQWSTQGLRSLVGKPLQVRLSDLNGRVMLNETLAPQQVVSASKLPSKGLFVLEVDGIRGTVSRF